MQRTATKLQARHRGRRSRAELARMESTAGLVARIESTERDGSSSRGGCVESQKCGIYHDIAAMNHIVIKLQAMFRGMVARAEFARMKAEISRMDAIVDEEEDGTIQCAI